MLSTDAWCGVTQIIEAIARHQVILIAGETGCGKTTQVPQYILEVEWAAGRSPRIVCSQPRRISATSVAARIAAERGEDRPGTTVGYRIRLDSVGGPATSLRFVTTGVLLKMMTRADGGDDRGSSAHAAAAPGGLAGVTHVVVDEVHERDKFADFALVLLRDVLPARPDLRVVLMSATLQMDLFSGYFGGCPTIEVPGFTHPVRDYFLEDVLRLMRFQGAVRWRPRPTAAAIAANETRAKEACGSTRRAS